MILLPPPPALIMPAEPRAVLMDQRARGMLSFPVCHWGGVRGFRVLEAQPAENDVANNTYTFSGVSVGSPQGNSLVAVEAYGYNASNNASHTFTSISIDGTNGTINAQEFASGIAAVSVVSGIATRATVNTSISITVNFSKSTTACIIKVYRLQNLVSTTASATTTATTGHAAATGTSISTTMNIPSSGVTLQTAISNITFTSVVGTIVDVAFSLNGAMVCRAMSQDGMSAETNRTFSASTNSTALITLSAATWQ